MEHLEEQTLAHRLATGALSVHLAIAVIDEAPFLTTQQRRDILYNNAARFLRLGKEDIARHHSF